VYLHGFKPEVTEKTPLLKKYSYAYLDRAIVLAGGPQSKVVAVITLPENLAGGPQTNHGAAEASTSGKGGTPPTGSVPSHTSPESVK
jgi:hypothetical protein